MRYSALLYACVCTYKYMYIVRGRCATVHFCFCVRLYMCVHIHHFGITGALFVHTKHSRTHTDRESHTPCPQKSSCPFSYLTTDQMSWFFFPLKRQKKPVVSLALTKWVQTKKNQKRIKRVIIKWVGAKMTNIRYGWRCKPEKASSIRFCVAAIYSQKFESCVEVHLGGK